MNAPCCPGTVPCVPVQEHVGYDGTDTGGKLFDGAGLDGDLVSDGKPPALLLCYDGAERVKVEVDGYDDGGTFDKLAGLDVLGTVEGEGEGAL